MSFDDRQVFTLPLDDLSQPGARPLATCGEQSVWLPVAPREYLGYGGRPYATTDSCRLLRRLRL